MHSKENLATYERETKANPGKVVCSVFLSRDKLLRVEELAVGSRTDLINNSRLQKNLLSSSLA